MSFRHDHLPFSLTICAGLFLSACSPAAQNESGRVPGGTDQQDAINAANDSGASNTMPGIGAPGTGGQGTQP
ncbi:hypothetical protein [Sphingobium agri]|uniref:Lipoprotein n=1 Tax=Sphingobium agri TaxID=2933566 RepID=A0ABT0E1C1_9SPHN|nr:hypothetical protein [Sphingobium agri]MCK0533158.1 hypothetical protein [Sphingobium agri]